MKLIFCITLLLFFSCSNDPQTHFDNLARTGEEYFIQKNYQDAIKAWEKAILVNPDDIKILEKLGNTYALLAEYTNAIDAYYKVLALKPSAWDIRLDFAKLQLISGDLRGAEISYEILEKDRNHDKTSLLLFHGDLMVCLNRFDEAESSYLKILEISPHSQSARIRLASCYRLQGKDKKAVHAYNKVVDSGIYPVDVLFQMGNYWKLKNRYDKAEIFYKQAINTAPDNLFLSETLIDFYIEIEHYDRAYNSLKRLVKQNPANLSFKKLLVDVCLALNRIEEAKTSLDVFSKGHEDDIEFMLITGKYYLLTMQPVHAITYFRQVIEKEPDLPTVHYILGIAYLSGNMNQLALQSLIKATELDMGYSDAELAIACIYYKQEDYDLSLEYARRVCEREPNNFRGYMIMGNVFLAQEKFEEATSCFEAAERLDTEALSTRYYKALTAEFSNQIEKSIQLYKQLIQTRPHLSDASLRYARLLIKSGYIEQAFDFFLDYAKRIPENGYFHHILGEIYLAKGNRNLAIERFNKAIEAEPKLVSSYMMLAKIYEEAFKQDSQLQILESCIENVNDYPEAYIVLAKVYKDRGLIKKAIEILKAAPSTNGVSASLENSLAWLYLELDENLNMAMTLAQSAYEKLPNDPAVTDTLGWAFFKQGIYTRALWFLNDAHRIAPDNPVILFHMGVVYKAQGDKDKGIDSIEKSITLGLKGPDRDKAIQMLDELKKEMVPASKQSG